MNLEHGNPRYKLIYITEQNFHCAQSFVRQKKYSSLDKKLATFLEQNISDKIWALNGFNN